MMLSCIKENWLSNYKPILLTLYLLYLRCVISIILCCYYPPSRFHCKTVCFMVVIINLKASESFYFTAILFEDFNFHPLVKEFLTRSIDLCVTQIFNNSVALSTISVRVVELTDLVPNDAVHPVDIGEHFNLSVTSLILMEIYFPLQF